MEFSIEPGVCSYWLITRDKKGEIVSQKQRFFSPTDEEMRPPFAKEMKKLKLLRSKKRKK